ncbi:bifunctional hydroxymethylpyrimidine kinase/phosphomethylpyrimidine kinase [Cohnella sp. CFH 77786]|uniref:bifunctional hydroxymethylpyrimidine kinase/phosphomethylpyrimidine kinase n=1 Tax=Cohnella sp. CFH 77786 TaxID=2662265 RepID=UPI001C60CF38|nr:bifunctional hydroxymethylpyrimidine kinase/phosphomethylpyrimidine kinase [Cohnella sp. CFH 77786]MBW5446960.1 bifunctional hydroxymethylpyrimidine kinase/phosphomethylpyrimidine kinase [Cohnella sp. CFH 77786]
MRGGAAPLALTVAGSDSGGGAGVQADLKTFQELGVFGMSAITALTAQNSLGVQRIEPASPDMVEAQMESVLSDIGADAVKTGMLPTAEIVERVAGICRRYGVERLVVDPVKRAKGGSALTGGDAWEAMIRLLLPLAEVVTPNIPEACAMLGNRVPESEVRTEQEMETLARELLRFGSRFVLLKGGHRPGSESADVLVGREDEPRWFRAPRIPTPHTHGTGCTTASSVAAGLARGLAAPEACRLAKAFVTAAIGSALPLGGGIGSLRHSAWREQGEGPLASAADFAYNGCKSSKCIDGDK